MYSATPGATLRVAALRHRRDYHAIGTTFDRLMVMAGGQGLLAADMRSFGIYYDDPATTATSSLRSEACVMTPADRTPAGELQLREIAGGRYAVTLHVGPYAELHRVYTWLFGVWLPASGHEAANAPCIEEYLNDPRTLPPTEWRTEVWLPLQ